ncbi:VIN3-like protein 2 [Acorus gramineus]|uniref:VIN3-like protein 2 n=1 Tax=Acorus gramineus TaxID=55184 RepID=A0AAV9B013_ACOGR|nr:VIN3-like protein 2 [Acorus gramineus]
MGKERKYTGLTKIKIIEQLLKIVSEKKSKQQKDNMRSMTHPPPSNTQSSSKKQRKSDHPSQLVIETNHIPAIDNAPVNDKVIYCKNSACRAIIRPEDAFCKRCSCCICHEYDENKDPSLWLFCSSEPPYQGESCGMSCHLECAFRNERSGIAKMRSNGRLEGSFYCVSCSKVNDLLGKWRKQLIIAKEARRVETLGHRLSVSHKLLNGTIKYHNLHEIVDLAMKKLEAEVGPLDALSTNMARGIVNRLSCGAEVQKLCARAIDSLDMMSSSASQSPPNHIQKSDLGSSKLIKLEDVASTSISVVLNSECVDIVHYTLWHRKADTADYPIVPTCILFGPNKKFLISGLIPSTAYTFKIVSSDNARELEKWEINIPTDSAPEESTKISAAKEASPKPQCESPKTNSSGLSNPSLEGDGSNNTVCGDSRDSKKNEILDSENLSIDARKEASQGETAGHSVSTLDEERAMMEVGSFPESTNQMDSHRDSMNSTDQNCEPTIPISEKGPDDPENEDTSIDKELGIMPYKPVESVLPSTPFKLEINKDSSDRVGRPKPLKNKEVVEKSEEGGSSSKIRSVGRLEELMGKKDGLLDQDYEYCVKVVRWLETEGHIEKNFRVKFLTWYSLRATQHDRKIVSVYVDALIDDPASLAGQLVDTFSGNISSQGPSGGRPPKFCMHLFH